MQTFHSFSNHSGERREYTTRRQFGAQTLWYGLTHKRRTQVRRLDEPAIIDIHPARFRYLALAILALSCLDAAITVTLLQHGATELNPVMAALMTFDLRLFVFFKTLITGICAGLLILCARFRLLGLRGEAFLKLAVWGYAILMCWETYIAVHIGLLNIR